MKLQDKTDVLTTPVTVTQLEMTTSTNPKNIITNRNDGTKNEDSNQNDYFKSDDSNNENSKMVLVNR
ncbi:hypothetical protein F8M41_021742 [Gigaspora margarita]|uniref:Uncharacterized protein n=1 Tax=Gigaspora margarita TaxID=4874 RepID=A0A8H4AG92_GIGMA|nr:hypothetical protein F8M41_021742 [Gigaspora margarita]